MQDIVKAKVLIELLDDRKYSVLSSFSSDELTALNAVDLVTLNSLTDTDINGVVGDFLTTVQQHQASIPEAQELEGAQVAMAVDPVVSEASTVVWEPVVESTSAPNPVVMQTTVESDELSRKLAEQPLQILAFILKSLDEDKAQLVRSKLTPEQLNTIAVLDIDQSPISQQVIQVIIDDLNL